MMERIIIIGFMGSGKSTIANGLSSRTSFDVIDYDNFIENKYNLSIAQIFDEWGEGEFRKIETENLKLLNSNKNVIIALGGGTPCSDKNISEIKELGPSIYLKLSAENLTTRLFSQKEFRPLIRDIISRKDLFQFISDKLVTREAYYNKANYIVDCNDLTIKETLEKIMDLGLFQ